MEWFKSYLDLCEAEQAINGKPLSIPPEIMESENTGGGLEAGTTLRMASRDPQEGSEAMLLLAGSGPALNTANLTKVGRIEKAQKKVPEEQVHIKLLCAFSPGILFRMGKLITAKNDPHDAFSYMAERFCILYRTNAALLDHIAKLTSIGHEKNPKLLAKLCFEEEIPKVIEDGD